MQAHQCLSWIWLIQVQNYLKEANVCRCVIVANLRCGHSGKYKRRPSNKKAGLFSFITYIFLGWYRVLMLDTFNSGVLIFFTNATRYIFQLRTFELSLSINNYIIAETDVC